jgi:hypothetical protein
VPGTSHSLSASTADKRGPKQNILALIKRSVRPVVGAGSVCCYLRSWCRICLLLLESLVQALSIANQELGAGSV